MELITEGRHHSPVASEEDIVRAVEDDDGRGGFIILARAEQTYIQAAGEGDGPYVLEYRDGNEGRHFASTREVSKAELLSVLLKYLHSDPTWITDFTWEKVNL